MNPREILNTSVKYARKFANWTMSLKKVPTFGVVQTNITDREIIPGKITVRRPRVTELGRLLAEVLTYDVVNKLMQKKLLSPDLARELGAIIQHAGQTPPFNLVAESMPDPTKPVNPESPPQPSTDTVTLLGLLFPNLDGLKHFKQWYESGDNGDAPLNFEKDLVQPLLYYYCKYREDYPEVRGYDLGYASTRGAAVNDTTPYECRDFKEPKVDAYEPYPDVEIVFGDGTGGGTGVARRAVVTPKKRDRNGYLLDV